MDLNFYKNGQEMEPRTYSNGKSQLDTIQEIIDGFEEHDIIYLKGVVGSGKSVIGIRTALELGGGIVSVPTKMLSRQYRDDYSKDDSYFEKDNGEKADIKVMKGRSNFQCPYLNKREGSLVADWKTNCQNSSLPCTKPLGENQKRSKTVKKCNWAGLVTNSDNIEATFDKRAQYCGVSGIWSCLLDRGDDGNYCPYWSQYVAGAYSDIVVMNSIKAKIETWIGRLPQKPLFVVDEADMFLDNLSSKLTLSEKRIEKLVKEMKNNGTKSKNIRSIEEVWQKLKDGKMNPFETLGRIHKTLEKAEMTNEFYWDIGKIMQHAKECSCNKKEDNDGNLKVEFIVANPGPILDDLLDKMGGKVLMMSATAPSKNVMREIFKIDPLIIEGETKFPGTIKQRSTSQEMKVNYDNWKNGKFRVEYFNLWDKITKLAEKPAFTPCHATKYLPKSVESDKITQNEALKGKGVSYSTKMDRGADLGEKESLILQKYPFPNTQDPLLKAMRKKLGESKFWKYYRDLARREFIQQVGRIMRDENAEKEFWSPDKKCHEALQKEWEGEIEKKLVIEHV
mgnify:CR=1 FL=1